LLAETAEGISERQDALPLAVHTILTEAWRIHMAEEGVETHELKESLDEAAEGGEGKGPQWIMLLSLSTAVIAVLAAIGSLLSGSYANDAIVQKNDAILHQSKADDAWGYYQAKSIKAALFAVQQDPKWQADSARERRESEETQKRAQEEEKLVTERDEMSERSLHVHHQFAKSVTIFQVAIALAAIAALTRRKPMWWVSLGMGALGVVFFALGLLPSH
jgi:hypothetical protein